MKDRDVYIIGAFSSTIGKKPSITFKTLAEEAVVGAIEDAGLESGVPDMGSLWFGNCALHCFGQGGIRGQVCLSGLLDRGVLPEHLPITNVENGCATASTALLGAARDIRAGDVRVSMALGIEKLIDPDSGSAKSGAFAGGIDQLEPSRWQQYYTDAAASFGHKFSPDADRTLFMDTYATQAAFHMHRYGTTQRQLAIAAAKTHNNGALNPRAQYQFQMTPEDVLDDRDVVHPFTRSMCAPIGDGAAGAILCSGDYLKGCDARIRSRAVHLKGVGMAGGKYRDLAEPSLSWHAARKAYAMAGVTPADIDLAELHDATSFGEIYQSEMMGFCEIGQGGAFLESGEAHPGGSLPINVSGGLVSKGHPIGATGLSMIYELVEQLRGEAGDRQVADARLALAENGGGVVGFDEAACVVSILER